MRNRSKLLLAGLSAALVLATAVGTASANRLSVSELEFRINWAALTFSADDLAQRITCGVTLLGRFHSRTITKTAGLLIGNVTSATIGVCTGDTGATVLQATLPWHVTYRNFAGRLPAITGVGLNLINASFQVRTEDGSNCLARTTTTEPGVGIANVASGQVSTLTAEPNSQIDITDLPETFLCDLGGDSSFNGTGDVRTPAGGLVFISLI